MFISFKNIHMVFALIFLYELIEALAKYSINISIVGENVRWQEGVTACYYMRTL